MEENPQLDAPTRTTDRIRAAIDHLSKNDLLRLTLAARSCLFDTEYRDARELFHEAVARAMEGRRNWPHQRVPFVPFLIRTMESIADASRQSPAQARTEWAADPLEEAVGASSLETAEVPSPEQTLIELEEQADHHRNTAMNIERLNRRFEKDRRVQLLVTYLFNGKASREICAELRWTQTDYATVRKRFRRGVEEIFRGGRRK